MPAGRLTDTAILAGAVLIIVLLAVISAVISPAQAESEERGSSYSAAAEGAKAAYVTLKQLGYRIDRSIEPLTAITAAPATTTLVIASPSLAASDLDRNALHRFMERGGVVLATGPAGANFLGATAAKDKYEEDASEYSPAIPSPLAAGAPGIHMAQEAESPRLGEVFLTVYGTAPDGVVQTARIGAGRAIWWAGSTPLTNEALAEPGHVELLLNALGPKEARAVLWDEHYHGHARSLWSYAVATPLPWAGLQLALIAACILFTYARRRGPVRPKVIEPRTSPMEFVDTMGGLYEQAALTARAVAAALARLRRQLVASSGLPPASSDDALSRAASARLGVPQTALDELLAAAGRAVYDYDLSPQDSLALVGALQGMTETLRATRSGTHRRARGAGQSATAPFGDGARVAVVAERGADGARSRGVL